MADHLQLRIVTPVRLVLDEQVLEVTGPGTLGQFGVLPRHTTFLTSLESGPLSFKTESGTRVVAIRGGFAEVKDDVMTVLAEEALLPSEIDAAQAEADLREATAKLASLGPADDAYAPAQNEQAWAQARLDVARAR
jgi:F-type H+-transporting ATPase subunit epsilon